MMTDSIAKSSGFQIQTPKRGTNTHIIELLPNNKSREAQNLKFIQTLHK